MNDIITRLRRRLAATELRGRALWVVIGCLICQMGLGLTYVKSGLSTELIEALHLSRTQFSGANTPQLALQALASPLAGYLTVRYGASRVLAGSSILFALVFLVFAQAETVAGFYFAVAGVGLGAAGMGDVTIGHVVTQWIRKNRGLALGIAYAGSNLGGSAMMLSDGRRRRTLRPSQRAPFRRRSSRSSFSCPPRSSWFAIGTATRARRANALTLGRLHKPHWTTTRVSTCAPRCEPGPSGS